LRESAKPSTPRKGAWRPAMKVIIVKKSGKKTAPRPCPYLVDVFDID
jgi:hypothetical protein